MQKSDEIRLRHMLEAAKEAIEFASGKSRDNLDSDRMLVLALVKEIEIIGEAATKISDKMRDEYPNVPWRDISGMRNRLVHAYFDVSLDVLWATVEQELPGLVQSLEEILGK